MVAIVPREMGCVMKAICYLRVSTKKQVTDGQRKALADHCKRSGIRNPKWVSDVASGRRNDRRGLQWILANAVACQVIVFKLDRLGRSTLDVLQNVERLLRQDCQVICTSQGLNLQNGGDPVGKLILTILAAVAEIESSLISDRVKASIEHRRSEGKHVGRKIDTKKRGRLLKLRAKGLTHNAIAAKLGCTRQAVSQLLKAAAA